MTLREHIDNGEKHYQRQHMGTDFWRFVLKGEDFWGNSNETWKEETQDIKDGKALVLCPDGISVSQNIMGNPIINYGVLVIYPKFKNWKDNPKLKNFRELTKEEIFKNEVI